MNNKRRDRRTQKTREQRRKVIILGDGKSEMLYFNSLSKLFHLRIKSIPMGKTGIDSFLKKVRGSATVGDINLLNGDVVVFVMDDDGRFDDLQVKTMTERCERDNCLLFLSNPSFELWLYLHYKSYTKPSNQTEMEYALKELLNGYEKSDGIIFDEEDVRRAIVNAERLLKMENAHPYNAIATIRVPHCTV